MDDTLTDHAGHLRFNYFTSFTPSGSHAAPWYHPGALQFDYTDLDDWIRLAQTLEAAKFDSIFWADHSGVHDVYQGSYATAVREAVQFPTMDPLALTAALASSTKDIGFVFSANVIQDHPYSFARRLTTLDHLTRGRAGWNMVTSFQPSAWANLGFDHVPNHAERYGRAEEFVSVVYKLLEGSWEDDAVIRDTERRIFADPSKVHAIGHQGEIYRVPGIHPSQPSPQRVPVLFQAGSSGDGRAFSARNAEAVFITALNERGAAKVIADMKSLLAAENRRSSDLLYFVQTSIIVGSTEEEAKRKEAEADEYLSSEALLAFASSTMGVDLSEIDLDSPVGNFETNALQGQFRALAEAAPDKSWTFREVVKSTLTKRIAGHARADRGRVGEVAGGGGQRHQHREPDRSGELYDFAEHVAPVLQARGLMQREYAPGTFREKLFSGGAEPSGPHINDRHPAATYRATHATASTA
jgi:FMN-dependent oxidoreductase (nitrilotriacetate monooxygenase family)